MILDCPNNFEVLGPLLIMDCPNNPEVSCEEDGLGRLVGFGVEGGSQILFGGECPG